MPPVNAIANVPHTVALPLTRCVAPNSTDDTTSATTVPARSSRIRNSTPRNSASSITATPVIDPAMPSAPNTEPHDTVSNPPNTRISAITAVNRPPPSSAPRRSPDHMSRRASSGTSTRPSTAVVNRR